MTTNITSYFIQMAVDDESASEEELEDEQRQ